MVWVRAPESDRMNEIRTSIIVPGGAIKLKTVVLLEAACQKPAREFRGGTDRTCAASVTETVVSLNSTSGEFVVPLQLMEQVAESPCAAGGVHIST